MIESFSVSNFLDPHSMFGILTLGILSVSFTVQPRRKINSQPNLPQNKIDKLVMKQRFEPRGFVRK